MEIDWGALTSAVVAVLAVLASVFSAIGSARSADKAGEAEKRMARGERDQARRELRRSIATLGVEANLALKMIDNAVFWTRSAAVATGNVGGSREKLVFADLAERRKVVEDFRSLAEEPQVEDGPDDVLAHQIKLDTAIVGVRGHKEAVALRLRDLQHDRVVAALRDLAFIGH